MPDPAAVIGESRLFSVLSPEQAARLLGAASKVKIASGMTIFSKGDPAAHVYVVLAGEIAIEIMSEEGRTVRVATLTQGDVFGELAVLDNGDRTADANARSAVEVLKISKSTFETLVANVPAVARFVIGDLIQKLRTSDEQLEDLTFKSLSARLAALLLKLADEATAGTGEAGILELKTTQAALGDRLSATREKVNIHLQSMQEAGAIALARGKVKILDREKLAMFARTSQ